MSDHRIALVTEHGIIRQLLAQMLTTELGLTIVAQAGSVAQAEQLLTAEEALPDLVIVGSTLSDGRGGDVVRRLSPRLPQARWFMLSAREQAPIVREAANLGVQGFVMTRSDLGVFRDGLRRVLAGETYYCPAAARLLAEHVVNESAATSPLTPREREVLRGYARGENTKVIAQRLGMNVKTVQNHLTSLKDKLGMREPAELVRYAMKHGYVDEI
ncbi:MAG: response regulator transcription factor [Candidatus Didemnitutus sp.]|nr:response regulator transcription factor [Candidatus Didemnitutus sp.]